MKSQSTGSRKVNRKEVINGNLTVTGLMNKGKKTFTSRTCTARLHLPKIIQLLYNLYENKVKAQDQEICKEKCIKKVNNCNKTVTEIMNKGKKTFTP